MHPSTRRVPVAFVLLGLLLLRLASAYPTHSIDMSATPGWANLDTCIQFCFTGAHAEQSLEARLGCKTKSCLCGASTRLLVGEFMDKCSVLYCKKPRKVEWWKVGAWKTVFQRYCEGDFGPVEIPEEEDGLEREVL